MPTPTRLRDLAAFIEHVEENRVSVTDVHTPSQHLIDDHTLTVQLVAHVQWESLSDLDGNLSLSIPDEMTITAEQLEGGIDIPLEVTIEAPTQSISAERSRDAATTQVTDGGVALPATSDTPELSAPVTETDTPHAHQDEDAATTDETTDASEHHDDDTADSPPPHRDPTRLREVYEAYATFPDMTAALDVDVSPQTVRHHMIKHDIHQPDTRDEAALTETDDPSADESPPTVTDHQPDADADDGRSCTSGGGTATTSAEDTECSSHDPDTADARTTSEAAHSDTEQPRLTVTEDDLPAEIDLPSHLTLDDVTHAIVESQTLYEVQRALRLDRNTARRLLRDLDLLTFVSGRIATSNQQTPEDVIAEHLRQVCT